MTRDLVLRGVPRSIALDGWWLSLPDPRSDRSEEATAPDPARRPDQVPRASEGR